MRVDSDEAQISMVKHSHRLWFWAIMALEFSLFGQYSLAAPKHLWRENTGMAPKHAI